MNNITTNPQPRFSILIANYNNGQYLQECLDSVFAQTYKRWEVILVDDASTDSISIELYNKYKTHPQVNIFYNKENKGCGYTKYKCTEKATGELCAFLDPDDAITNDALETMVKAHIIHPKASLIYSQNYICDELLNVKSINQKVGPIPVNTSFLIYNSKVISALASFKKHKYNYTQRLNPTYKRAIDHDLYYKLEEVGETIFIERPLYYYRQHSKSISLNKNRLKALYWDLRIKKDAFHRRAKTNIPNITRSELNKLEFNYYIAKAIEKTKTHEYKKMYYCLAMASRFLFLDKNLSTIRIAFTPIKKWIK